MSLPSSMADFVQCDRLLQKAYCRQRGKASINKSISYSAMLCRVELPFKLCSLFLCLLLHTIFVVSQKGHCQRSDRVLFCIVWACNVQRSMEKSGVDILRARSFGVFRNKNIFRNIFRLAE